MSVKDYVTLGRSGLRVSPLSLGTMTFGNDWGWGADENISRSILNCYIDAGGNFIDIAVLYTGGTSEKMVGQFIRERNLRDRVVLATKFTFNPEPGNPNAGGNGRKNICRTLEAIHPYTFYGSHIQSMITGGASIHTWAPARATGGATLAVETAKAAAAET